MSSLEDDHPKHSQVTLPPTAAVIYQESKTSSKRPVTARGSLRAIRNFAASVWGEKELKVTTLAFPLLTLSLF